MNRLGYSTAPEWAQAAMVIGELLREFGGGRTIVSVTESQGEALEFAHVYMSGCSDRMSTLIMERILKPLDDMPYCDDPECPNLACHVHKPAVAAILIKHWVEIGTQRAMDAHGAETLDGAWKLLSDLARATEHPDAKALLDGFARAAFNKAREIVAAGLKEVE